MKTIRLILIFSCILIMLTCTSCAKKNNKKDESISETSFAGYDIFEETTANSIDTINDTTSVPLQTTEPVQATEKFQKAVKSWDDKFMPANARKIDMWTFREYASDYINFTCYLDDNIIMVFYSIGGKYKTERLHSQIRFYDYTTGELMTYTNLPIQLTWISWETENLADDVYCNIVEFTVTGTNECTATGFIIKKDGTYETYETDENPWENEYSFGSHTVKEISGNIIDAENGKVLAEGEIWDSPFTYMSSYCAFEMPLDDDRFVYSQRGQDSDNERKIWNIGIYNYHKDKATKIPGTYNILPIGYHNGKIYSKVYYAGEMIKKQIHITEATGYGKNTVLCSNIPDEYDFDTMIMSNGGGFVLISAYDNKYAKFLALNADTCKIIGEYVFEEYDNPPAFFIDDYTVGIGGSGCENLYILDLSGLKNMQN